MRSVHADLRGTHIAKLAMNLLMCCRAVQEIQSSIQDSSSDGTASNMHIDLASFRSVHA